MQYDFEKHYRDAVARAMSGDTLPLMELVLRIQNKSGEMVPFVLKPAQRQYWYQRSRSDLILKAAQLGFTTLIQGEIFIETMMFPGREHLIVAQTDRLATRLFDITKRMYRALPAAIRPPLLQDSAHVLEVDHSGKSPGATSAILVGSAESDVFGRGRPVHRALFTEVAFYGDQAINTMGGIIARMPAGISRWVKESTANGQAGHFFEEWEKATEAGNSSPVKPHFFPWWLEPDYAIPFNPGDDWGGSLKELSPREHWLEVNQGLSHDQIRWRRFKKAELGQDQFQQEFPETPGEAFLPIGSAVFPMEAVSRCEMSVREPLRVESFQGIKDAIAIWGGPVSGRSYILALDQASGETRDEHERPSDFQVFTVWDAATLTGPLYRLRGREIGHRDMADMAAQISAEYNNALIVPERNLAQFGFMEMLDESGARNIYMHQDSGGAFRLGFPVTSATKTYLVSTFRDVIESEGSCTLLSRNLIREMRNFRFLHGMGKKATGATPGGNDDELITAMIAFLPEVRDQALTYSGGRGTKAGDYTRTVPV